MHLTYFEYWVLRCVRTIFGVVLRVRLVNFPCVAWFSYVLAKNSVVETVPITYYYVDVPFEGYYALDLRAVVALLGALPHRALRAQCIGSEGLQGETERFLQ